MNIERVMHEGADTITPETPVAAIAALMKTSDIGALPVREKDRVVGIVTDRDLAIRALADGRDVSRLTARDVMTADIVSCRADQSIEDAIHVMEEKKIRRMPVVDRDARLVGMLALGDIAHHVSRELGGELLHAVAAPHR
ncbi:CBS domain-containing protein [Salinarimonas sp. NSM]|uniref:CBS domain-containing protein n=1 Tax=Salinarimonas sp. NSM TaxID=3458003 RepID=UPI004035A074